MRRFPTSGVDSSPTEWSPRISEFLFGWYCKKFGLATEEDLKAFYRESTRLYSRWDRVLDSTRGSSRSIARGGFLRLDVSDAAHTTFENTRQLSNCAVVQADLMDARSTMVFSTSLLPMAYCITRQTRALRWRPCCETQSGGQFYFYLYRKMGAARQFSDAHIRGMFSPLQAEECYRACEGLTELGRELSQSQGVDHA